MSLATPAPKIDYSPLKGEAVFDGLDLLWVGFTIAVVLVIGGAVAYMLPRFVPDKHITGKEYLGIALPSIILLTFVTGWVGTAVARDNATGGYEEFWNTTIVSAEMFETECYRDGPCWNTYPCDVYYETEYYLDANGKQQSRQVERWHDCPYATYEYSYWLVDAMGDEHSIASHIFGEESEEWRGGSGLPGYVDQGIPTAWQEAKDSIEAGDLPPATSIHTYTNYLLASQDSTLAAYSDSIERYREDDLLPYHTSNLTDNPIYDGYKADKVVFAGMDRPASYDTWQGSLGRLNSYLGSELQGDLHVVIVPANRISNPDDYTSALLAYWQSRELGERGLAKNAIMLVIGASDDGQTVEWARADTGIPEGNGEMIAALSMKLNDEPLVPETLLGRPTAQYEDDELTFTPSDGVVEQIVLRDYPYQRPCMECKDDSDSGSGYVYLKANAYISTGAKIWISIVIPAIISLIIFGLVVRFDPFGHSRKTKTRYQRSRSYYDF